MIIDETIYEELVDRYEDYFTGGMGAEAIQTLIRNFDLDAEAEELRTIIAEGKGPKENAGPQTPQGGGRVPTLW